MREAKVKRHDGGVRSVEISARWIVSGLLVLALAVLVACYREVAFSV